MSRVRSKNTTPELIVRRIAHGFGYRFRLHRKDLSGTPDLVFPRLQKIILVHGCFWHFHEHCKKSKIPATNSEFWERKLNTNRKRDKENLDLLTAKGWKVLTIWECELKDEDSLHRIILDFLFG